MKRSGHARLKAALVLRDALATELGITLPAVMAQLRGVEENLGAAAGLHEGKYLEAMSSVGAGNTDRLTELDMAVRAACDQVAFAPRYAQYLALILFAYWYLTRRDDPAAFIERLNAHLAAHRPREEEGITPFTEADLQLAAFWMATAAGKTHVLHVCLALAESRQGWDRIIVVTPSESLTRQHADKLRALAVWDVFAYPMDGEASALGRLPADTVIVLDINKLASEKKGDGVTVPTSVFAEGRNLVFVDEGHKGQKAEASVWKALQGNLAGIDAPDPGHRGLLIEFSATFGQVAEGEHSFGRYAKSIVFDYAYDRFHRDRYGKDFWHLRLQAQGDAGETAQRHALTAALLAYWHQMACFRSTEGQQAITDQRLEVSTPLWVLLGLSVIGGKTQGDKAQTSDVVAVLAYLSGILARPARLRENLTALLDTPTIGANWLPAEVRQAILGWELEALAERILTDCCGWQPGDKPVLRLIKSVSGELGLGVVRGDACHYYGVVNVGDAPGLKKALEAAGLAVEDDALAASLFGQLDAPGSSLNILIGSRRFAEGWDNYRASSLTLLRLGQGEGSLIIQMFGRVVRFAGVAGDGKRLERPPAVLAPLQTAYVYGLQSGYLDTFLQGLMDNGVMEPIRQTCPTQCHTPSGLRSIRAIAPEPRDFQVAVLGSDWLGGINPIRLSLTASIAQGRLEHGQTTSERGIVGGELTTAFKARLGLLDRDWLYRDLVAWKRTRHWWNVRFDPEAIAAALASDRYQILGLEGLLDVRDMAGIQRLNRLAATVVRRLFESAYRKQESRNSRYDLIPASESYVPDEYFKEFPHGG